MRVKVSTDTQYGYWLTVLLGIVMLIFYVQE